MIRPDFRKSLLSQQGALLFIWGFFAVSIFIYIVITHVVLGNSSTAGESPFSRAAKWMFWLLVLVDLGYLVWWKKRFLTRQAILDQSTKSKILRALEEHKGQPEQRAASVISTYVTRKIVAFAIIEAIAVYGLVLAFVTRNFGDQYLLSALSLILLAVEFPAKSFLEKLVDDLEARL